MLHTIDEVLEELTRAVKEVSFAEEAMAERIENAAHVFVAGAGRSGMIASGFAMRLMHLGFPVYRVGECTTPASRRATF